MTSRIDVIGSNGGDGAIYHFNHKHGHGSHKKGLSPTYISWRSMRARCLNESNHKYPRYGGRGITIDKSWDDFVEFLAAMGDRPAGTTLGRIDNNGNYGPSNCRWETPMQQANNTSANVALSYKGETKNIEEWIRSSGIPRTTFYRRYYSQCKRGEELFAPTVHMAKADIFERILAAYGEIGVLNYTAIGELINESRRKVQRIYLEFTQDEE